MKDLVVLSISAGSSVPKPDRQGSATQWKMPRLSAGRQPPLEQFVAFLAKRYFDFFDLEGHLQGAHESTRRHHVFTVPFCVEMARRMESRQCQNPTNCYTVT